MILYFYDLKIKGRKEYNTLKRRFYRELKSSKLFPPIWKTKSVIMIANKLEKEADAFFVKYTGLIEVYKARTNKIEDVL
jgi:hypothetical protein